MFVNIPHLQEKLLQKFSNLHIHFQITILKNDQQGLCGLMLHKKCDGNLLKSCWVEFDGPLHLTNCLPS